MRAHLGVAGCKDIPVRGDFSRTLEGDGTIALRIAVPLKAPGLHPYEAASSLAGMVEQI